MVTMTFLRLSRLLRGDFPNNGMIWGFFVGFSGIFGDHQLQLNTSDASEGDSHGIGMWEIIGYHGNMIVTCQLGCHVRKSLGVILGV